MRCAHRSRVCSSGARTLHPPWPTASEAGSERSRSHSSSRSSRSTASHGPRAGASNRKRCLAGPPELPRTEPEESRHTSEAAGHRPGPVHCPQGRARARPTPDHPDRRFLRDPPRDLGSRLHAREPTAPKACVRPLGVAARTLVRPWRIARERTGTNREPGPPTAFPDRAPNLVGHSNGARLRLPTLSGATFSPTARLGRQLREARLRRGLDLPLVEARTDIQTKYLRALESERFDLLPDSETARSALRAYASHLELDPEPYIGELDARIPSEEEAQPAAAGRPAREHSLRAAGAARHRDRRLDRVVLLEWLPAEPCGRAGGRGECPARTAQTFLARPRARTTGDSQGVRHPEAENSRARAWPAGGHGVAGRFVGQRSNPLDSWTGHCSTGS